MDALAQLWTFQPDLKVKLLCIAIALQAALAIRAYSAMSKKRVAAAKAGKVTVEQYKATTDEPEELRVMTRAVANQFEMPVLFFAILVAGLAVKATSWIAVVAAFVYVALRFVHQNEMIGNNTVMRRRRLFIRSAQIMLLILIDFVISVVLFAQA